MFKKFNNLLALVLVFLIVTLWILQGLGTIKADAEVAGATIATFTLIVQFYFRKAPAETTTTPPATITTPASTPPASPAAAPATGTVAPESKTS